MVEDADATNDLTDDLTLLLREIRVRTNEDLAAGSHVFNTNTNGLSVLIVEDLLGITRDKQAGREDTGPS